MGIMGPPEDVEDGRNHSEFPCPPDKLDFVSLPNMSLVANPVSMFTSFTDAFYHSFGNGSAVWMVNTNSALPDRTSFWTQCETVEVAEQYVEFHGSATQDQIPPLLDGLSNSAISGTPDFASWNGYNDDVMWAVIALTRGYAITGDRGYLDHAKTQFDSVWSRAYDDELGGGLWWTTNKTSKNACINAPAALAAQLLANNGAGDTYHDKAVTLFNWTKATLYNDTTGQVFDNIQADGTVEEFSFSYNQGTFVGAATLLANNDPNSAYLEDAAMAVNYTRLALTHSGTQILNDETSDPNAGDSPGFKGIFFRWAALYTKLSGDTSARDFLIENANQVWHNKNSNGLSWTYFMQQTPETTNDTTLASWGSSSAVSAAIAGASVA